MPQQPATRTGVILMIVTEDVLQLVSVTKSQNSYGVWEKTEELKQVYCKVSSVSQSEFFEAGRNGLNPEWRFMVFAGDYNGEETVIFQEKRYGVYRTFYTGDWVELYVQRKGGTNVQ